MTYRASRLRSDAAGSPAEPPKASPIDTMWTLGNCEAWRAATGARVHPKMIIRDDFLPVIAEQEFQIRPGEFARAMAGNDFALAIFAADRDDLRFEGRKHIANLTLDERSGRTAASGIEDWYVAEQLAHEVTEASELPPLWSCA